MLAETVRHVTSAAASCYAGSNSAGPIATAAQAHALATFPFTVVFEYNYQTREIPYLQENWITFDEGKVYTNDRPGLGVEVDTDSLRLLATYTEANDRPMYYRPDGSPITW